MKGIVSIKDVLWNYDQCNGDIRQMDGFRHDVGLCGSVFHSVCTVTLWKAFVTWPKFCGSKMCPVPASEDCIGDARSAVRAFDCTSDKYEGDYGALRIELFHYVIAELRKIVDEQSS